MANTLDDLDDLDALLEPDESTAAPDPVTDDLDDLLVDDAPAADEGTDAPEPDTSVAEEVVEPPAKPKRTKAPRTKSAPAESDEDRRIRELRNALAEPEPEAAQAPKTAKQREIEELENQLALKQARILENSEDVFEEPTGDGDRLVIHVVSDGLTINGHVTVRGDEFEFVKGGRAWNDTLDRNGKTYLDKVDDPAAQVRAWGEVKIARGPWPGKRSITLADVPATVPKGEREAYVHQANTHLAKKYARRSAPAIRGTDGN